MKSEKVTYFIDSDDLVGYVPDEAVSYTSALSSDLDLPKVDLDAQTNTALNYSAWEEIIGFYNRYRSRFEQFEQEAGFNIWFFLNFRLYFEVRNHKLRIATIKAFLDQYPNGKIITSDQTLSDHIPPSHIQIQTAQIPKATKFVLLKRIIQEFAYIFGKRGSRAAIKTDTVIISKFEDHINNINRRFHLLEKEYDMIGVRSVFDVSNPLNKADQSYHSSVNLNGILSSYFTSFSCFSNYRQFENSLNRLFKSFDNRDGYILRAIRRHKSAYVVYHLIYHSFLKYFKKSSIKNILVSDENSPQTRAIVEAARQCGIHTFGFQHGTIHDLHPAYIFGKYDGVVPLPTKTFVWGSHYADLLIKDGGYKSDQVSACGRLPVYVVPVLNNKIDHSRKVIVFATQPQRNPALRRKQLVDVLTVAKDLVSTYQLVIRPHPRERDDQYFLDIAMSVGYTDLLIDRESDLLSHFDCCHVLITSFSTVGLEFIPYYKPLLVLDYLKEDLIGYVSNGVGIPVYDSASLLSILSQEQIGINKDAFDQYLNQFNRPNDHIVEEIKVEIAKSKSV